MSYEKDLIETEEIGDYRIKIYGDYDAQCPVSDWDMGAIHLWEHLDRCRWELSAECDWKSHRTDFNCSLNSLLVDIISENVEQKYIIDHYKKGMVKDVRLIYNRKKNLWELQSFYGRFGEKREWHTEQEYEPFQIKSNDYVEELLEVIDEDRDELINILQLYAKDIVVKEWGSSGYSQGDAMRGISYMTKEMFDKRCGFSPSNYKTWQEQAMAVIEGEIKCIETWAWGDVKGYVLEKQVPYTKTYADGREIETFEWEEVDSCWGFYMTTDELIQEVIAEHDLKQTT